MLASHFNGNVSLESAPPVPLPPVDLAAMAGRAMNYLLHNPQPEYGYGCRFDVHLARCLPGPAGPDLISDGDTDSRIESVIAGMRAMSGRTDGMEVDEGLHRRIRGYLGPDHLSVTPYALTCSTDLPPDALVVSPWTTGWTLRSLADRYARTGDRSLLPTCQAIVKALAGLAERADGRAWYAGGCGPWLDGKWLPSCMTTNYPSIHTDVAHYAEVTGDEQALDFAHAFARGVAGGRQANLGVCLVRADGSFTGHTHLHTRAIWGVAQVGRLARDRELLEWATRAYEFVRRNGADWGWFPERTVLPGEHPVDGCEERALVSETCCTGDMAQTAAQLALAGEGRCWDHLERYVSNYLAKFQWRYTPQFEAWYRQEHAALPAGQVEQGLAMIRGFAGAFAGTVGPTDWEGVSTGPIGMGGCCMPEAMRALHAAWLHGVATDSLGTTRVRLAFPRETERVKVEPAPGRLAVTAKQAGAVALRPPAWVERETVGLAVDGQAVPAQWVGGEVRLTLAAGSRADVTWPEPVFAQEVEVGGDPLRRLPVRIHWQGNRVLGIEPEGREYRLEG